MASEAELEAQLRGEWVKMLDLARRENFPAVIYTRNREFRGRVNNFSNTVVEIIVDRQWTSISLLTVQAVEIDMRDGR